MRLPAALDAAVCDAATELIGYQATAPSGRTSPDRSRSAAPVAFEVDPDLQDETDYATRPSHPSSRRRAARPPEQSEGDLAAEVLKWLNGQPGTFARKVHPDIFGGKGEPDVDGCARGRTFKIELKVGRNRPSRAQETSLRTWQNAGALVGWARTLAEVQAIYAHLHDPHYRYDGRPGAPMPDRSPAPEEHA